MVCLPDGPGRMDRVLQAVAAAAVDSAIFISDGPTARQLGLLPWLRGQKACQPVFGVLS